MTPQLRPPGEDTVRPLSPPFGADRDSPPSPPEKEPGQVTVAAPEGSTSWHQWRPYLVAAASYLAVSVVLWWHVLPHPASVTTCGCGDQALTLWVLRWPAYALSHGLNPFYSSKLFVPHGINMAPNSLGLGVVMAPITWAFGPVASLNVIDLVSPPLSALAMFWLLRRWVVWAPAAFVGGLFFGFSPFVLVSLALGHPNFGLLAPVPLIIGCVDDLLFRRNHRPLAVGMAIGLLLTVEFFISVEVLLLLALFSLFALVAIGGWALVRRPPGAGEAIRRAVPGLLAAGGVAAVLLAYPLWFFFAGPAHLEGRAWPDSPVGTVANTPTNFLNGFVTTPLTGILRLFGGYQGPNLPLFSYLGIGMVLVIVVGAVMWRHDRLLLFFGSMGVIAAVLSLGVGNGYWAPWRLFTHFSVLNNVVPVNITVIVDTCVAVMLAVIVAKVRTSGLVRLGQFRASVAGLVVAAVALVPVTAALWPNIPLTVRPVVVPRWFAVAAPHLDGHQVVLPYPAALGGIQASMAWQASEGMTFSMVGGGGPGITASRAGKETPGFRVLARASLPLTSTPLPTASNLSAIRAALRGWGVTTVVIPDQPEMPTYDRGRSVAYAVGLFTAALGAPPVLQDRAWVWTDVQNAPPPRPVTAAQFGACTGAGGVPTSVPAAASCVLRAR